MSNYNIISCGQNLGLKWRTISTSSYLVKYLRWKLQHKSSQFDFNGRRNPSKYIEKSCSHCICLVITCVEFHSISFFFFPQKILPPHAHVFSALNFLHCGWLVTLVKMVVLESMPTRRSWHNKKRRQEPFEPTYSGKFLSDLLSNFELQPFGVILDSQAWKFRSNYHRERLGKMTFRS